MEVKYQTEKKCAIPPPKPVVSAKAITFEESVGVKTIQQVTLDITGISSNPSVFVSIVPSTHVTAVITEVNMNKIMCDLVNKTDEVQLVKVTFLIWP